MDMNIYSKVYLIIRKRSFKYFGLLSKIMKKRNDDVIDHIWCIVNEMFAQSQRFM